MRVRNPLAAQRQRYKYERLDGVSEKRRDHLLYLSSRNLSLLSVTFMALSLAAVGALLVSG